MHGDDDQLRVRACWLYYMEGLTQAAIAERISTSRLRVNRLLMEARASGLVGITINSPLASCVSLEQRLVREHGLRQAIVIPSPADQGLIPAMLGRQTAELLSRLVDAIPHGTISVGWGATLRETIRYVRPGEYPALQVTSMMGGLTFGFDLNTFEIASELARRWNAQCHYLAAPIYAGSRKSHDTILAQDVFEEAFARVRTSDVAVLSVGDLSERSLLIRNGLPPDVTAAELAAAGAVGDVLGQFLDSRGRPIRHALNDRVMALPVGALAAIPTVILASGGVNKAPIIAATLRAGLIDVLVSDEITVTSALELSGPGHDRISGH